MSDVLHSESVSIVDTVIGSLKPAFLAIVYNVGPILVVLLIWEFSVKSGLVQLFFFPAVSDVLVQFWKSMVSGEIPQHFVATIRRMVIGFGLGAGAGVLVGLALGLSVPLRTFFYPIVAAVYPLPKIALLSIFLVIFGIGDPPIIAAVTLSAFFPVLLNTLTGLRTVDPVLIRAARDLGASRLQITFKVVLFAALPMIFAGFRQSSAVSLIVVVAVEMYIGQSGAGYLLSWATEFFKINLLYANILAIGIFGILLFKLVDLIEYLVLPWARER